MLKNIQPKVKLVIVKLYASAEELELIDQLNKGERDFTLLGSFYFCQKYKYQAVTLKNPNVKTIVVTIHAVRTHNK